MIKISRYLFVTLLTITSLVFSFNRANACNCGCNMFNISTNSIIPGKNDNLLYVDYQYLNQNRNWQETSKADSSKNHHLKIITKTANIGWQKSFNENYGLRVNLPIIDRAMTNQHHNEQEVISNRNIGDLKLSAYFNGIEPDLSSGIIIGIKLPTGDYRDKNFIASSQIGTATTDIVIGGYKIFHPLVNKNFSIINQINFQQPILIHSNYRPGKELAFSTAVAYNFNKKDFGNYQFSNYVNSISPLLQLNAITKTRDAGANASKKNTGYEQIFISPALEIAISKFKIYNEIQLPIYREVNGMQLVANYLYRTLISYQF